MTRIWRKASHGNGSTMRDWFAMWNAGVGGALVSAA